MESTLYFGVMGMETNQINQWMELWLEMESKLHQSSKANKLNFFSLVGLIWLSGVGWNGCAAPFIERAAQITG